MKYLKIILPIMFLLIYLNSCDLLDRNLKDRHIEQQGYIADTLSVGIENVKITVLKAEDHSAEKEETDMVYYTDNKGYYEINIDNEGYIYYMKMEHDEYIYVVKPGNFAYPQIASFQSEDEEQNYEMVKKGPVKIEGDIRYVSPDLTITIWLDSVKVSVLKRPVGSTNYPDTTGIYTFTDENGNFYIEYPEDKSSEFFLKPEKEGYYYDNGNYVEDCGKAKNYDPGYIISWGFEMKKIGE